MTIECAFLGTVAKDATPKTSAAGKPYMRITMRVGDGEAAQWVFVTVFGDTVAALDGHAIKGAKLYVEGRLTLDKWKSQDGTDRHALAVAAFRCEPPQIGRNRKREKQPKTKSEPAPTPFHSDQIPF